MFNPSCTFARIITPKFDHTETGSDRIISQLAGRRPNRNYNKVADSELLVDR